MIDVFATCIYEDYEMRDTSEPPFDFEMFVFHDVDSDMCNPGLMWAVAMIV